MSAIWAFTAWGFAAAYISKHGVDTTAIVLGLVGALPVWTFIAKRVDAGLPGVHITIDSADLTDAFRKAAEAGPEALRQAEHFAGSVPITGRLEATLQRATLEAQAHVQEWSEDPNLALVSVRIGIERRVRVIAELLGLEEHQPLARLVNEIHERGIFTESFSEGLTRLVEYGNAAAHGATINVDSQNVTREADQVFKSLDEIIKRLGKQ
jgi:hypothetical protein